MRFLVLLKANAATEAGELPTTDVLEAMGTYNEELVRAGVLLAADGLQPTSKGARVRIDGGRTTVTDGPFAETKELIAGFWLLQCRSLDEAIEWVRRSPLDGGAEVEVRPVYEADDFGEALTPELRDRGARVGEQMAENARR